VSRSRRRVRVGGARRAIRQLAEGLNRQLSPLRRKLDASPSEWIETERILDAWRKAGIEARPPADVLAAYRALAAKYPVILALEETAREAKFVDLQAAFEPEREGDYRGTPVLLLWTGLPDARERRRLKRCQRCTRWFADESKNAERRFCSGGCRNRWWSRGRRREARRASRKLGSHTGKGSAGGGSRRGLETREGRGR
jgi:hypothetical protein